MAELTASLRKTIAALGRSSRERRECGMFVAEGTKCVLDTLGAFRCVYLPATQAWLERYAAQIPPGTNILTVRNADMERMSHLSTAPEVMAVYRMPMSEFDPASLRGKLCVALDCVQDPGNLGTIIRVADWMGVSEIICSRDTADAFSPKTIQATMGAISRVRVHYVDLAETLASLQDTEIIGTFLDGENIYSTKLPKSGVVVMGNEGRGISQGVAATVSRRVLIPSYPQGRQTSESLNVAVATAITLAEFRRQASL